MVSRKAGDDPANASSLECMTGQKNTRRGQECEKMLAFHLHVSEGWHGCIVSGINIYMEGLG